MSRLFSIAGRVAALILLLAFLGFSSAPYLLNRLLLPRLLSSPDTSSISVHISSLTPWSLTGTITLDTSDITIASPAHFSLSYRPSELIHRKVSALAVDGGTVRLAYSEGKLRLADFASPAGNDDKLPFQFAIPSLPVMIEALYIRNTQILITEAGRPDLLLTTQGEAYPAFEKEPSGGFTLNTLKIKLLSHGLLPGSLEATAAIRNHQVSLNLQAHFLELAGIARILPLPDGLSLNGSAQLDGEIVFPLDFKSISHVSTDLRFPGLNVSGNGFTLVSSEQQPLVIRASGTGQALDYTVNQIALTRPAELQSGISGTFLPATGELSGKGEIQTALLQHPAAVELQGKIERNTAELTVTLLDNGQLQQISRTAVVLGPYRLSLNLKKDAAGLLVNGDVRIASVQIDNDLLIENISGQLPFSLNPGYSGVPDSTVQRRDPSGGRIVIDRIRYKNSDLAGLTATLRQTADGLGFSGNITTHLASPLQLQFAGESSPVQPLKLTFNLPRTAFDNRSLPALASLPAGLEVSGKLKAEGTFSYSANSAGGGIKVSLSDGEINFKEKKLHLGGIASDLSLPVLPSLASASHQKLHIASMEIGNLKFTDGNVFFRIEDQQTFFIEKSRFNWCNGKVESGSLVISLADPELSTTLYCDRLQFSELLSQLGISDTEGDGSLNGRLPLHFNGKQMIFDDGFLFSTPGNSGIVRFNNTAMLRQGLPETSQTSYLDYSMQAMENFSYNWTKLTFNSQGDDLLISMEIDGKPAKPLPFGYQSGQLVARTEGPGIQHPIRLDVNFHLPFTQMFKYGQNIKKIMEKKK